MKIYYNDHGNFLYDLMFYIKTAQLLKGLIQILMGENLILLGFNKLEALPNDFFWIETH